MHWELIWVIALLVGTLTAFILEKWPTDLTAIGLYSILVATALCVKSVYWPTLTELTYVFASPAPLTIAAMFVLSAALERCGVIEVLADFLGKASTLPYKLFLAIFIGGVTLISAFVNNTVVVVVLMPVILGLARRSGRPASKFLIPLSYASIFGGCCTLIGTSTNILASEVLQLANYPALTMFELSWVGVPAFLFAWLYLTLFADKLLPANRSLGASLLEDQGACYLTEAQVAWGSPFIGMALSETGLLKIRGVVVLEIIRSDAVIEVGQGEIILQEGDSILLSCEAAGFLEAHRLEGFYFPRLEGIDLTQIAAREGRVVEGVVGPTSALVGQTIAELNRNPLYRLVFLGVRRKGEDIREGHAQRSLCFGDILLLIGTTVGLSNLNRSGDLHLLDRTTLPSDNARAKQPWVLAVLAGIVIAAALDVVPIVGVMMIALGLLLVCKTIPLKEAYAAIDWRVLSLLYGMLGLGMAMEKTGFAHTVAMHWASFTQSTIPVAWAPYCLLGGVYVGTVCLTELLSNNATIILMGPLAIKLAEAVGMAPRPFVIAACIASSAGFMIPTGYQTHTYVYGVGNYRFRDFLRIGWPLNLGYAAITLLLVPIFWPLE